MFEQLKIKRGNNKQENTWDLPEKWYCEKCQKIQGYRIKHCSKCRACISKYDHHCFWIGGCVGELNLRKFWLMLLVMTIFYTWCLVISVTGLQANREYPDTKTMKAENMDKNDYTKEYGAFVMTTLILVLALLFVVTLLIQTTWLACINLTMWESNKRHRITYLKIYPKGFLPFYKGIWGNFKEICCHSGILEEWKLPDPNSSIVKDFFNPFDNEMYSCC